MRRALAPFAALAVLVAIGLWFASAPRGVDATTAAEMAKPGDVEAGRVVFAVAGCESCHVSAGQSDPLRLGGGTPMATPFGTIYPPNISPDRNNGIGGWTPLEFADAILTGVSRRGEHLYPALPYPSYRLMTTKDARDLFAYLLTLPPVAGKAPPTSLAFPFSIRRGIGLWKLLYTQAPPAPPAGRSAAWSLGRYLVEGPGHCGECHSPRDMLGGVAWGNRLKGGALPDGKGKAPALTPAGLKDWSKDDIAEALSSGFTPTGDTLGGAMAAVVRNTAQLPGEYRSAMAEYLKAGRE